MCVIAVCYKRKLTSSEIENCWASNSDGAGIAWSIADVNHFRKGFMKLRHFMDFYRSVNTLPHIVHFRLESSGGVCPELCHPFPIRPDVPLDTEWHGPEPVLFHNGVVSSWKTTLLHFLPTILEKMKEKGIEPKFPGGPWSDTRAVAAIVSAMGVEILNIFEGKYAVLHGGKVKLYGDFIEEKGVWFSNYGFYGSRHIYSSKWWKYR